MEKLGERRSLSSQERLTVIIRALSENHVAGLSNKEIALEAGTTEATACRDMGLLDRIGWAVSSKGRWRLSPAFGGLAGRIMRSYQEAKLRLTEEEARYASEMQ